GVRVKEWVGERRSPERRRDEAEQAHRAKLHPEPDFARQNQQLARNVVARQIVARIRLREAHLPGLRDELTERNAPVVGVEEITERSRENAFDLDDLVTARDEIAERRHDRQSGTALRFLHK